MQITKRFIYPPRPAKNPVQRHVLDSFVAAGWKAQLKYNDDHVMLSCEGDEIDTFTRTGKPRTKTQHGLEQEIFEALDLLGLDRDAWNYLDCGLLATKGMIWDGKIVLWDILVADGKWLLNTTYKARYDRLVEACKGREFKMVVNGKSFVLGHQLTKNIFIPATFENPDDVWAIVEEVNRAAGWNHQGEPPLEGCMLKNYDAVLEISLGEKNNMHFMTRSRVTTGRHLY